ncbi:MAG: hypothetical protein HY073_01705, partial [Deltaproteobacteria bacterium]|nr:hypothetical protein [Deltaproteobacteria bacterium]
MKKLVLVVSFFFCIIYPVPSFPYAVTPGTLSPTETLANLVSQSSLIVSGTVARLSSRYPDGYDTAPFNRPVILTDVVVT